MRIRSLTCFVNVDETLDSRALERVGELIRIARDQVAESGYELTTARLALQPLDRILKSQSAPDFAVALETRCRALGFDYAALLIDSRRLFEQVVELLARTENVFASLRIASRDQGIQLDAVSAAARIIHRLAHETPDGMGNFRFAAAANVPAGVPFFPAAFAGRTSASFAFAAEAADLAVTSFTGAPDLEAARGRLISALEENGRRLQSLGQRLAEASDLAFRGIDFSMAPFPDQAQSLGTALERLVGAHFGMRGTLFAAAFVTDCLRRARFERAGFSGLMLPVLEDWTLATRSQEVPYTLDSLLLYSSVCGTGLDTVPLAGNTSEDAIAALLLDLAALAIKLDKPLTARLIPVPDLAAGETTRFTFEYFANARAFEVLAGGPLRPFKTDERVEFTSERGAG